MSIGYRFALPLVDRAAHAGHPGPEHDLGRARGLHESPATTLTVALGDAEALDDVELADGELVVLLLLLPPLLHAASAVAAARVVMPARGEPGRSISSHRGLRFLLGGDRRLDDRE
jgi:hypothetical protein